MYKRTLKPLRLGDDSMPTVGNIYHACFDLQECIKGMDLRNGNKCVVLFGFQARWNMLLIDLRAFGYVPDPEFEDHNSHENS